jgi:hypothetical protein
MVGRLTQLSQGFSEAQRYDAVVVAGHDAGTLTVDAIGENVEGGARSIVGTRGEWKTQADE